MQSKKCCKCKAFLPVGNFTIDRSRGDGLSYTCKICAKATSRIWYDKNKDRVALTAKAWKERNPEKVRDSWKRYQRMNRCRVREATRRWAKDNREHINEYARAYTAARRPWMREKNRRWREANKDKVKALNKKWHLENEEYHREQSRLWYASNTRRALARVKAYAKTPLGKASLARQRAKRLFALKKSVCTLTAEEWLAIRRIQKHRCLHCLKRKKLTMDHIHPLSKGGSHTKENIQGLCRSCNSRKGAKLTR